MLHMALDIKRIHILRGILHQLSDGAAIEGVRTHFQQHFQSATIVDLLLMEYEIMNGQFGLSMEDLVEITPERQELYGIIEEKRRWEVTYSENHPLSIFRRENQLYKDTFQHLETCLKKWEEGDAAKEALVDEIQQHFQCFETLHYHYNRKEKLFFPILERHGHYTLSRTMWKEDEAIRNQFKAAERRFQKLPEIDIRLIRKSFNRLQKTCKEMMFQEEEILLPIVAATFSDAEWQEIAEEGEAFGYAVAPGETWQASPGESRETLETALQRKEKIDAKRTVLPFGGGFLTLEQADLLLNHLPLEITFVNKQDVFAYFNEKTASADMLLVRTSSSIGRNVANCHPPKSMSKCMALIRDLKTKRRMSETMWFKMKGRYIHITYTGVFDDEGEYAGILETVQDINPFLELSREEKRAFRKIPETASHGEE